MNSKLFKTLSILGLATVLPFSASANDQYEQESNYDMAYGECNEVADNQATDDNWQDIFNNCMSQKGFETEQESNDYQDDTSAEDKDL